MRQIEKPFYHMKLKMRNTFGHKWTTAKYIYKKNFKTKGDNDKNIWVRQPHDAQSNSVFCLSRKLFSNDMKSINLNPIIAVGIYNNILDTLGILIF